MKQSETEYLNKLFSESSDVTEQAEVGVPQVDVPASLTEELYAIANSAPTSVNPEKSAKVFTFPKVATIAASLFVAVMGFQFYQQQQTIKQLEQAQSDLATALHYLGEANRIAQSQVLNSLNDNIKKAGVEPAMEFGREVLRPESRKRESRQSKTQTQKHSL